MTNINTAMMCLKYNEKLDQKLVSVVTKYAPIARAPLTRDAEAETRAESCLDQDDSTIPAGGEAWGGLVL